MRATGLVSVGAILMLAGCGDGLLRFDVDKDIDEQTIDGQTSPCSLGDPLGLTFFDMPPVTVSQEEDFPEQPTTVDRVQSATLKSLRLSLTNNSQESNWDWLDTLYVYVNAEGQDEAQVAHSDPVKEGVQTIHMEPADTNLAPYVKADNGFTLTSDATGCPPSSDVAFDGRLVLRIGANPI